MQNILKILLILTLASTFSNCVRYENSSGEKGEINEKTTVNDNDTSVSDEITDEVTDNDNSRKGLFREEDMTTEKQNTYTKFPNILGRMVKLTTRTWVKEPTVSNNTNTTDRSEDGDSCPTYKKGINEFNYTDMIDLWQVVYYQETEKVQCFKIYVKMVSITDKDELEKKFGCFNGRVRWNDCNLEIRSSAHTGRTHYLQGKNEDGGVLQNIIIMGAPSNNEKGDSNITPFLRDETPDQWMVTKNLLLMRDCETGNCVVFSRLTHQPMMSDILEALTSFGEEDKNGKMACMDEEIIKPYETDEEATSFD